MPRYLKEGKDFSSDDIALKTSRLLKKEHIFNTTAALKDFINISDVTDIDDKLLSSRN
jgi:hypothetical protein